MLPTFSIVIANYNYGRFLETAIQSVIAQGLGDDVELIVVDGGSTDNSVEIIKRYAQPETRNPQPETLPLPGFRPITWWVSEPDKGQSAAFNKGFAHARGRFLTWLNADDVLMPGALKAVKRMIEKHPEQEWFAGSSVFVDKELRIIRWFRCHKFSRLRAKYGSLTCGGPSTFFTKSLLDEVGGLDENLHYLMDIDLWYKFVRVARRKYIRTTAPVFAYRIHEESKMGARYLPSTQESRANMAKATEEGRLVRERHRVPGVWVRRVFTSLTISWLDKLVSVIKTMQCKGRTAMPTV